MASFKQPDNGEKQCCFKYCTEERASKVLDNDCSRVNVKSFERKQKGNWLVNWDSDGSASFHRQCWETLVLSTKNSYTTDLNLSDVERSMIMEAKKTAEFHDGGPVLKAEGKRIADMLKSCKYCIAFTGAGISTAAGIGDFRGKDGKWTQRDKAKNFGSKPFSRSKGVAMNDLRPTYTHEALCLLADMGYLKFMISQNTDGLHRLSGFPAEKLSELHGNSFTELCEDCGTRYELKQHWRQAPAGSFPPKKCTRCKLSHRTGRRCKREDCKGYLMNTIINFGDFLESEVLSRAQHHAKMADCALVLGSTLRVSPANELVTMGEKPLTLILCNRNHFRRNRQRIREIPASSALGPEESSKMISIPISAESCPKSTFPHASISSSSKEPTAQTKIPSGQQTNTRRNRTIKRPTRFDNYA